MSNLTEWFVNGEKPYRPGIYLRKFKNDCAYAYWDGIGWSYAYTTIEHLLENVDFTKGIYTDMPNQPWRGLTENYSYKIQPELHHAESREHYECHTG